MVKFLLFLFFIGNLSLLAQRSNYELVFSHKAVSERCYKVFVENPSAQLRSYKVTLRGKNFKTDDYTVKTDTIAPNTKKEIYLLKKKNKSNRLVLGYNWIEAVGNYKLQRALGHKYRLPYSKGEKYKVIQGYYEEFSHEDKAAIDFGMPVGTPVLAMRGGQIFEIKLDSDQACEEQGCDIYANYMKILHYDGTIALYKGLLKDSSKRRVGDFVAVGEVIARSGFTGKAKEPNLQIEIQVLNYNLSNYIAMPFECVIEANGQSDVLNSGEEYTKY